MDATTTNVLVQYGALGVSLVFTAFAVRILFQQQVRDKERETARADRLETALQEQNKVMQEKVIPAALELVNTTKALIELIAQEQARRRP